MTKRINIVLPSATLDLLDRVTSRGNRSRFIAEAVNHYIRGRSRRALRRHLVEGYKAETEWNRKMAEEWFPLENEAWQLTESRKTRR